MWLQYHVLVSCTGEFMCPFESCDKPCYIEYIDVSIMWQAACWEAQRKNWNSVVRFLQVSKKIHLLSVFVIGLWYRFQQHFVTRVAMHGHRLHSQTCKNIISLQRCMCVYNNSIICRKIFAVSMFLLAQSLAVMKARVYHIRVCIQYSIGKRWHQE